jgi:hypothetical protein
MLACRCRTGKEHDLEDQSLEDRSGLEECVDPDMHIRFHTLCVKSSRFTIVHITVEVVATCLASNPHLLILKLHNRTRRSPRCVGKIRDNLIKVRVETQKFNVCEEIKVFTTHRKFDSFSDLHSDSEVGVQT